MKRLLASLYTIMTLGLILGPLCGSAHAQSNPPIGPSTLLFNATDADFNITASYLVEFFQCTSIDPVLKTCVGQATSPFQSGSTVPKANITTLNPVDPTTGNNRSLNMKTSVVSTQLASYPIGVAFVPALTAIGDPVAGGTGNSPRSAAGNPFYQFGKTPASPTALTAR